MKESKSLQDEFNDVNPNLGLEDKMNQILSRIGLAEWTAIWAPNPSKEINGQVLVEQKTILVFSENPEKAKDSFLHELIEVKLRKLIGNHYNTINGLIKIIQELNHVEKERTIGELVPFLRNLFDE